MPDVTKKLRSHLTENLDAFAAAEDFRTVAVDPDACLPAREVYRHDRRVQRQFRFLLGLVVVAFLVLAVRSEVAQKELLRHEEQLRESVHEACEARAQQARVYNEGRLVMLDFVATLDSDQSPEAVAFDIAELREGLLLPIETCPPPSLY